MKRIVLILWMAASATVAIAQTTAQTAPHATTTAKAAVKPAVKPAHKATAKPAAKPAVRPAAKHIVKPATETVVLPPGVPPVEEPVQAAFALRYQDIKIGTGADAEPNKLYKIQYTGWRAADGVKFDSSYDHPGQPLKDKDGKPMMGADGKPVTGDPQPLTFPQGFGRLISGVDQGFAGMKVGGKRRLFVPWQLGYGTREIPAHGTEHPGIPAKSDLIFDVELLDVTDMPKPPARPVPPAAKPGAVPAKPGTPAAVPVTPKATPAPAATPKPAATPQSK